MKRFDAEEQKSFCTSEGVMTPLAMNEDFAVIKISMPKGLAVKRHSHHREGVILVTKGKIVFDDGERHSVGCNDVLEYGAAENIGFTALEDAEALFITRKPQWTSLNAIYDLFAEMGIKPNLKS